MLTFQKMSTPRTNRPNAVEQQISQELKADYRTLLIALGSWNRSNQSVPITWAYDSQTITLLDTAAYCQV